MSGPKTSKYTLTPEQRRILERQREMERRRAKAAVKIENALKGALQIGGMLGNSRRIAEALAVRTGSDGGLGALIAELEAAVAPVQPLSAKADREDIPGMEKIAADMQESMRGAEEAAKRLAELTETSKEELTRALNKAMDRAADVSFAQLQVRDAAAELRKSALNTLEKAKRAEGLSQECVRRIDEAAERIKTVADVDFLRNLIALSVAPLAAEAERQAAEYAQCREEFLELSETYAALCALYGCPAAEYRCCRASVEALRAQIEKIKSEAAEDDERAYISACLDEVMEEMGYSVLGSREVTKRSGARFRSELYSYEEGTAVSVTYSSDGRIAMELGGLDSADRAPDAQETAQLCDSMRRFCGDFGEIERRLLARGVVLAERISLLPPSAEYAQIINVKDFALRTDAQSFRAARRRRTARADRRMRRE